MLPCEINPGFKSSSRNDLQSFLSFKRSIGYKYERAAQMLLQLDRYLADHNIMNLDSEAMQVWLKRHDDESNGTHYLRVSIYRQLALHLNRHDKTIPLPTCRTTLTSSFVPYIFTRQQIIELLRAADRTPRKVNSSAYLMMPVMMRVLYCCGLRVSEATGLTVANLDLNRSRLSILHSKYDISRTLPIHESLTDLLSRHLNTIYTATRPDDFVFPTTKMQRYSNVTVYEHFRRLLWECGISHGGRGQGPRLHDLRHTFAVHSLQNLIAEDKDAYVFLPILARYLGHKNIYETEKYLRLTAEVYPELLEKVNSVLGDMQPEVEIYEAD